MDVVAVASRPLSGMMSCFAPSPAGHDRDPVGAALGEVDFLGLGLVQQGPEQVVWAIGRMGVHGGLSR